MNSFMTIQRLLSLIVDCPFKARIVFLILSKEPENALNQLSSHYEVQAPDIKIGMPKGKAKRRACYNASNKTIFLSHRDVLDNPHVLLHEFYHHLRSRGGKHRGTEKLANEFAREFLIEYQKATEQIPGK
jgi:Zn-dependent peptidase ImmA (M78 family)